MAVKVHMTMMTIQLHDLYDANTKHKFHLLYWCPCYSFRKMAGWLEARAKPRSLGPHFYSTRKPTWHRVMPLPELQIDLWPRETLTIDLGSQKFTVSCPFPLYHLCQYASKLVHSFSKYHVHKFRKRWMNTTNGRPENMPPPGLVDVWDILHRHPSLSARL